MVHYNNYCVFQQPKGSDWFPRGWCPGAVDTTTVHPIIRGPASSAGVCPLRSMSELSVRPEAFAGNRRLISTSGDLRGIRHRPAESKDCQLHQ